MRFVVKPGEAGGPPRVERVARWRIAGEAESEPTAEQTRDDLLLALRDRGTGPDPVLSFSDDGEAHLSWPDLAAADPELARLVALASVPLGREVPELAGAESDPQVEAAIERLVHEDRQRTKIITGLAEAGVAILAAKQRREWRTRRARRSRHGGDDFRQLGSDPNQQPVKTPPQEPDRFEGELTADGWRWQPVARARSVLRARARLRR